MGGMVIPPPDFAPRDVPVFESSMVSPPSSFLFFYFLFGSCGDIVMARRFALSDISHTPASRPRPNMLPYRTGSLSTLPAPRASITPFAFIAAPR